MQEHLISLIHRIIKLTALCLSEPSVVTDHQTHQGTGAQHIEGEAESWHCSGLRGSTQKTEHDFSQRQMVMGQEWAQGKSQEKFLPWRC